MSSIPDKDIYQILKGASIYCSEHDGEAQPRISKDFEDIMFLANHTKTLKKIVESGDVKLFSVEVEGLSKGKSIKKSGLGERLLFLARRSFFIGLINHKTRINPYYDLFWSLLESSKVGDYLDLLNGSALLGDSSALASILSEIVDELNAFVDSFRKQARSPSFQSKLKNFNRTPLKNRQSVNAYIAELSERYSKLLVIRLDLGYRQNTSGHIAFEDYENIKKDRQHFFKRLGRYLIESLGKDCLVGYIWKTEYGESKKWHHHAIVFLNGQMCQEDVSIARMIGEHWSKNAENQGLYYNCNALKNKYKSCGIGMLDYRDSEKRKALELAADYLTKPDYYLRTVLLNNERTFGRGKLPTLKTSRAGRPRMQAAHTDHL